MRSNEKRIVKNTAALYIRMLVNMIITFYTSRVVLSTLGIEDYGLYNIVGGIIILFAFFNGALTNSTQRYLNAAMASDTESKVTQIFFNSFILFLILAIILFISIDIAGQYFIYNILNINESKLNTAIVVLQFSALTFALNIIRTPFNAMVIAYEKMYFFSLVSIIETVLKLVIVWILLLYSANRVEIYSALIFGIALIVLAWFVIYCKCKIKSAKFNGKINKRIIKDLSSFTGWNILGGAADVGYTQGTNLILNVFHGVSLNAAYGLANQIRSAVFAFVSNLQLAANPQIVQSYTSHDFQYYKRLMYFVSKYSYILMLLISLPIIFNIKTILSIWLQDVPKYTAEFVTYIIIWALLDSLQGPLWTSMQAYGKIRNYQIITSLILLLNLPVAYLLLYLGYEPQSIILAQILIKAFILIVRFGYSCKYCYLTPSEYLIMVIKPISIVTIISFLPLLILAEFSDGLQFLVISSLISTALILATTLVFATTSEERQMFNKWFQSKLKHRK